MTLNGVGLMTVILRYFSEFAYLLGILRESSRSLSHLLMSSCNWYGAITQCTRSVNVLTTKLGIKIVRERIPKRWSVAFL